MASSRGRWSSVPAPGERLLLCAAALALLGASAACGETKDTIAVPRSSSEGGRTPATGCPGPTEAGMGVVALYTFDQDEGRAQVADVVGSHNGAVQLGLVTTVAGPAACDRAFSFGADGQYIVIDDSPDWDLEVGSIDLWLWLPAVLSDHVGVLSRDLRSRNDPGHLTLFVDIQGRAQVRVQSQDPSADNTTDAVECSPAPLPREQWVHLGINFGPPQVELYVDGLLSEWEGPQAVEDGWLCGQTAAHAIAGNDLPWVVGRATHRSLGVLELLEFPASECAIDHLRISSERRNFAALL